MSALAPALRDAGAPARPIPNVSRADLLRAAETASPWAVAPLAQSALEQQPGDDDLRLVLIRSFVALRLRTAALEQSAFFSERAKTDPRVASLIADARALPNDRVSLQTLEATCRANVDALARRTQDPVNLRLHLAVWRTHAAKFEWFATLNGNMARRSRSPDGRTHWLHLEDARTGAEAYRYGPGAGDQPNLPAAPIVIEGVDPPWLFFQVCAQQPRRRDGYWTPITLLQADPLELLDGLAQADLTTELSEARVRVLIGPNAGQRFADYLLQPERLDCVVTGPVLAPTGLRTSVSPSPTQAIEHAADAQTAQWTHHHSAITERMSTRDDVHIAHRFAATVASANAAPLRILLISCRFTTFVKHAASDLSLALAGLGHAVRTVIEPDDYSWLRPLATLRAFDEHDPDLIIAINYTRADMRDRIDPRIPMFTWVQDAMPQLLTRQTGAAIGPVDFLAGNIYQEHLERFGYPARQLFRAAMVASRAEFHDGPINPTLAERLACDFAYVSHHSQSPESLHAERLTQADGDRPLQQALTDLFPIVLKEVLDPLSSPLGTRLENLTKSALASRGLTLSEADLSRLVHIYTFQIADRALRHQTLAWAAEIAQRRGWRFHLYGRAWHEHPTLAPFARGELTHDEELRAAYACAKAHLQVTLYKPTHQRIIECALSGGLPLFRLHADDFALMDLLAATTAATRANPTACHIAYTHLFNEPVGGYAIADHPEAARSAAVQRALGRTSDDFAWLVPSHIQRVKNLGLGLGEPDDLFWLLGDPARVAFASREQLEERLELAITRPDRREQSLATLACRSRDHLTYDAFARRALAFIEFRLNAPAKA